MPIEGLTTKRDTPIETNTLGKAWKGEKRKQNMAGKDLKDRFRLELPSPYDQIIKAAYGSTQPKQIRVLFPHDTADQVFETWNDAFTAKGLKHRCNGNRIVREIGQLTSYRSGKSYQKPTRIDCDKPCQRDPSKEAICKECTSTGYLKFIVRELFAHAGMSQIVSQTVTGINDVVGIINQLRIFEEKYGSLKQSPIPSPSTWNHIPFVLSRVPREISRPMMDGKTKEYNGGRTRGTAYPIIITEDPEWLAFWQHFMQRQAILQMVQNGQEALLQPSDRAILQEMRQISLPMASPAPVSELPQPVTQQAISAQALPVQQALNPAPEYADVDTEAIADEDAAAEYREQLLARSPKERIEAVNEHLKLERATLEDLWAQTAEESEEPYKTSLMIHLMLVHHAEQNMVKQGDANKLIYALQNDMGLVDEGLTEVFISKLPNQIPPAAKEPPTTFNGKSID